MSNTSQKTKQIKNVAVAIVRNEDGQVLLIKPDKSTSKLRGSSSWDFPANEITPGATYTETFVSNVLETTGCIIEAVSLVSSEKKISAGYHYEYVECKVVCKDDINGDGNGDHKWVKPSSFKKYFKKRINNDIIEFLGLL
jgi:ADP-ribose pyrophosphatase YjhB (NUDIX family)